MAATRVQSKTVLGNLFGDSTEVLAFDAPTTIGNLVVVCVSQNNQARNISSVSDGTAFSQAANANDAPGRTSIHYRLQDASISNITVTLTGANADAASRITIAEYSGIDLVAPFDVGTGQFNSGVTSHPSGNISTSFDDLLVGALGGSSGPYTEDAAYTNIANGNNHQIGDKLTSTPGTNAYTPTSGGIESTICCVAAFKIATGGGSSRESLKFRTSSMPHRRVYI